MTTTTELLVADTAVQAEERVDYESMFDRQRRHNLLEADLEAELIRVIGAKEQLRSVNWPEARNYFLSLHLLDEPPPGVERLRRMIPGTPKNRSLLDWADNPGQSKHAAVVLTDFRTGESSLVATARGTIGGEGKPSILAEHSDAQIRLCKHHGRMYISRAATDPLVRAAGMGTLVTLLLLFYASSEGCADAYCAIWNENLASKGLVSSLGFLPNQSPVRYFEEEPHRREDALDMVVWSFPIVSISNRILSEFGSLLISLMQQGMNLRYIYGLPNLVSPDWVV